MFNFKPEKLNTLKPLRTGRFSTTYPYQTSPTDKRWMVRILILQTFDEVKCYNDEIMPSIDYTHPFIHTIAGSHIQKNEVNDNIVVHLKMPRTTNNLKTFIDSLKELPSKKQVIPWFYSICSALNYLESHGVTHGNLKPENLVFDQKENLLLSEIGFSQLGLDESCVESPNKERYIAPECRSKIDKKTMTKNDVLKADAWSLGMIMLDLCLGRNEKKIPNIKETKEWYNDIQDSILEIKEVQCPKLSEILAKLLELDPKNRANFNNTCKVLEEKFPDVLKEMIQLYSKL